MLSLWVNVDDGAFTWLHQFVQTDRRASLRVSSCTRRSTQMSSQHVQIKLHVLLPPSSSALVLQPAVPAVLRLPCRSASVNNQILHRVTLSVPKDPSASSSIRLPSDVPAGSPGWDYISLNTQSALPRPVWAPITVDTAWKVPHPKYYPSAAGEGFLEEKCWGWLWATTASHLSSMSAVFHNKATLESGFKSKSYVFVNVHLMITFWEFH